MIEYRFILHNSIWMHVQIYQTDRLIAIISTVRKGHRRQDAESFSSRNEKGRDRSENVHIQRLWNIKSVSRTWKIFSIVYEPKHRQWPKRMFGHWKSGKINSNHPVSCTWPFGEQLDLCPLLYGVRIVVCIVYLCFCQHCIETENIAENINFPIECQDFAICYVWLCNVHSARFPFNMLTWAIRSVQNDNCLVYVFGEQSQLLWSPL